MADFRPTGPDSASPPPTVPTGQPSFDDVPADIPDAGHEHPRGTLFLMVLFLVLIVGLWTYAYILLLQRS